MTILSHLLVFLTLIAITDITFANQSCSVYLLEFEPEESQSHISSFFNANSALLFFQTSRNSSNVSSLEDGKWVNSTAPSDGELIGDYFALKFEIVEKGFTLEAHSVIDLNLYEDGILEDFEPNGFLAKFYGHFSIIGQAPTHISRSKPGLKLFSDERLLAVSETSLSISLVRSMYVNSNLISSETETWVFDKEPNGDIKLTVRTEHKNHELSKTRKSTDLYNLKIIRNKTLISKFQTKYFLEIDGLIPPTNLN